MSTGELPVTNCTCHLHFELHEYAKSAQTTVFRHPSMLQFTLRTQRIGVNASRRVNLDVDRILSIYQPEFLVILAIAKFYKSEKNPHFVNYLIANDSRQRYSVPGELNTKNFPPMQRNQRNGSFVSTGRTGPLDARSVRFVYESSNVQVVHIFLFFFKRLLRKEESKYFTCLPKVFTCFHDHRGYRIRKIEFRTLFRNFLTSIITRYL